MVPWPGPPSTRGAEHEWERRRNRDHRWVEQTHPIHTQSTRSGSYSSPYSPAPPTIWVVLARCSCSFLFDFLSWFKELSQSASLDGLKASEQLYF